MAWPQIQTGIPVDPAVQKTAHGGIGIVRPLEAAARKVGVQILLQHRMTSVIRENNNTGRVVGITVETEGAKLNIRARKGVIICTGGHSSNVNFRRIFDPRLTEEYCGVAGEPYTPQDASGEIAGMAVGASLWGAANQTGEFGIAYHQGRVHRVPIRVPFHVAFVAADQRIFPPCPRHRPAGPGLSECDPR